MSEDKKLPEGFDWRAFTPADSPKTPPDILADPQHRDLSTAKLSPSERAYGFNLPLYDFSAGHKRETGLQFDLHEVAREKPVALIFGSYT